MFYLRFMLFLKIKKMSNPTIRSSLKKNNISWDTFWEKMFLKLKEGMTTQNYGEVWEYDCRRPFHDFPPDQKHMCFMVENLEPVFVHQNKPVIREDGRVKNIKSKI